jgi:serine/threonine protein kinase
MVLAGAAPVRVLRGDWVEDGTPFGRYRLLSLLGRGGMGEVWRAFDTDTNRVVAVKLLPANLAHDPQFEQRFRREANAAAGLNDPHVVPIHHFGEIDGRLYVDMRFIEGRDLHRLIADGPMHPSRAVAIIDHVASALDAAHRIGLMHRDVKPSNILIGERDFAYLIDFGIARAANDTSMTSTGAVIGTWAYLAPERITGKADHRADVYALTCVLHECLTGQQPFPGTSIEQQIGSHLGLPPPRPSAVRDTVPIQFDDVIAKGMAKNPDDRYSTVGELASAASAAITTPTTLPPRMSEAWHPNHTPTAAAPTWNTSPPAHFDTPPPPRGPTEYRTHSDGGPHVSHPPAAPPIPPTQPPRRSLARRRVLIPAILAAIVLVAAAVLATSKFGGSSSNTSPTPTAVAPITPPKPTGPTFDGTFTTAYGPQTKFDGTPKDGLIEPATWVVRSTCDRSGCVAAATTVNRPEGVLTRIFDYVDGRWVSVDTEPGQDCRDVAAQRWERTSLEPRPDGSLVGDFSSVYETGCSSRSPVTFTRAGDTDPGVQTADLATVPARIVSPAQGVHGHYHAVWKYTNGETYPEDYAAEVFCLRTGDRCLNYLYQEAGNTKHIGLVFAAGQWTSTSSNDDAKCHSGKPSHSEYTSTFPLPQPPQDPIQLLTGHGEQKYSGGCTGTNQYDNTLTRIGD